MVDAVEDLERTAGDLADAKRTMRSNKARLSVGAGISARPRQGTLSTLPAAPGKGVSVAPASQEGHSVLNAPPSQPSPDGGFVPATSFVQLLVAAALVAVLVAVWIAERRSASKDLEDRYGGR